MRHFKLHHVLFLLVSFTFAKQAQAYPDFIGYGYSSCITCHYNGSGSGALNDYGRALFATEIAARDVFPKKMEEEEIAAMSGFLGSKPLPWWFRPGIKYRGLWLKTDPGSSNTMERFINMQNDVNLNFFFDKKQRLALITTASYTATEMYYGKQNTWFAKEYYLRWKQNNNLWFYVGQLDNVYGLRNIDHTAVNRRPLDLGQYSQTQSVVAHFTYPDWNIAAQAFFGNAAAEDAEKQKGFSVSGEYQVYEKFMVGASALTSQSDITKWNLLAFTTRMGLSKGSSLIAEAGFKEKTNKLANTDAELGTYALVETLVNIRRGYNVLSVIEHSKSNINKSSPEQMKWSLGGLLFPLPRTELRMMATNAKTYSDSGGTQDAWALQGQVHISY
ncbi:hypothetical protein QJS83_07420 [Bdellovibrio sp. 22V]|uniref:hypothetical protein n=1 Tax=Bdellovibrio sp. 22V TaxID=3044166 RepID=UPI0025437EF0|nr:hypothetical protein [Bdellovibrio sp. 22V]WII73703.1 hypothetical protein QJS83_07420 [Bdellovibrio sp. 22V]